MSELIIGITGVGNYAVSVSHDHEGAFDKESLTERCIVTFSSGTGSAESEEQVCSL